MSTLNLFQRTAAAHGENVLTESLAMTLQVSREFQNLFFARARVKCPQSIEVQTQWIDPNGHGIPDLLLYDDQSFLLCEIKEDAKLTLEQWARYEGCLAQQSQPEKQLIAIVAPWTNTVEVRDRIRSHQLWSWGNVYQLVLDAQEGEKDPVSHFLLTELLALLEARKMKPFGVFEAGNITVWKELASSNECLANFFEAVSIELRGLLSVPIVPTTEAYKIGNYSDKSWRDHVYPGLCMRVEYRPSALGVWIGCECKPQAVTFLLNLWDDDGAYERGAFRGAVGKGYALDPDGRTYNLYSRYLVTQFTTDIGLQVTLAKEIAELLAPIVQNLQQLRPMSPCI